MIDSSIIWEFDILHWFQGLHNPVLDAVMAFFSLIGEAGILWIVTAVIFLIVPKYRKCGVAMAVALILSLIFCNGIMKNLVQRDRPFWIDTSLLDSIKSLSHLWVVEPTDFSFPSGHTSASFAAALAIFMFHRREGIIAIIVAALIAVSRLYLGVHFPTDVIVSLVLGSLYGIIAALLVKAVIKKAASKNGGETDTAAGDNH